MQGVGSAQTRVVLLAAWFVAAAAIVFFWTTTVPRYLTFSEASYGGWWPQANYLLPHVLGGSLALILGPFQFSSRLRARVPKLHRLSGRVYVGSIALASLGAFGLVATTRFGPTWATALAMLATAWIATTGVAFYCIKRRDFAQHREWMIRSYVVTFAFVLFRLMSDHTDLWAGIPERGATLIWMSWAPSLLVTEVILQARKVRRPAKVAA